MSHLNFKNIIRLIISFAVLSSCNNSKRQEIARIEHSLSGCFSSETNRLTLYEQDGLTFAKLETNGRVIKDVKLSHEQIKAFNSFTEELSGLKEAIGCTTVEEYILYAKNRIIKRTDGGCSWDGFSNLLLNVFDNTEK